MEAGQAVPVVYAEILDGFMFSSKVSGDTRV